MIDDEEWEWIVEHSRGAFDHLIVASTLPIFMAIGIHHLQAWNEALCAGRWGRLAANASERLRRAVDLEHWSAFNRSFEQVCDWLRSVARGTDGVAPPSSVLLLGGDVHYSSISEVDLGGRPAVSRPSARLLAVPEPALVERALGRPRDRLSCKRSRLCEARRLGGCRSPERDVGALRKATYENAISELRLDGASAQVVVRRSPREGEDPERLVAEAAAAAGGRRMTTSRVAAKARETLVSGERLLGEAISDQISSSPPPAASPDRLGARTRRKWSWLGRRRASAAARQRDRDPDRRRRGAARDREGAAGRAVAHPHDQLVLLAGRSIWCAASSRSSCATCSPSWPSASTCGSCVWAGAPLPLFRPSRREVRDMRERLTSGTRIQCALDSNERPMHCHHEKTIVIDDRVAFVGGIDLTSQSGDRFDSSHHPARERDRLARRRRPGSRARRSPTSPSTSACAGTR